MNTHTNNKLQASRSVFLGVALAFGVSAIGVGCASMNEQTADSEQPAQDTWITSKVMAELAAVNDLDNTDIGVETSNGVVTLTGRLESQTMVDSAVAAASRVDGVVSVDSSLVQVVGD